MVPKSKLFSDPSKLLQCLWLVRLSCGLHCILVDTQKYWERHNLKGLTRKCTVQASGLGLEVCSSDFYTKLECLGWM